MPVGECREFDSYETKIENLGFTWKGEYGIPGRRYSVLYPADEESGLVHLHMYGKGHQEIETHLLFRDYLRSHTATAQEYDRLKAELASTFKDQRALYTANKDAFIKDVLAKARKLA